MTRNEKKMYRRKIRFQKFMGLGMIVVSIGLALYVMSTNDPDITASIILAPIGLYLLFSKKCLIY